MVVGIIFGIVVGAFGIVVIKVVNMVVGIFGENVVGAIAGILVEILVWIVV